MRETLSYLEEEKGLWGWDPRASTVWLDGREGSRIMV